MFNKTNLIAVAIIAAAAFTTSPSANASPVAGMAANATTAITTTTAPASGNIILAHAFGGHFHGVGWGWGGGYGYDGGYGYGGGCRWLKRKWHRTGAHYWRKRYFRCINSY